MTDQGSAMTERRTARRFDARYPICIGHEAQGTQLGYTIDLSHHGLGFTAPDPYEIDDLVGLQLQASSDTVIHFTARIVRCNPNEDGSGFVYGANIKCMERDDRKSLSSVLTELSRSEQIAFANRECVAATA